MLLTTSHIDNMRLRPATTAEDAEYLRAWKNAHRQHFFFKDEITLEIQAKWFAGYLARKHDQMWLVEESLDGTAWMATGCMGARLRPNGLIDLYNILRGQRLEGSTASMGQALQVMLVWLNRVYALPITCEVLAANPARGWYEKMGLDVVEERSEPEPHVFYRLNPSRLPNWPVQMQG